MTDNLLGRTVQLDDGRTGRVVAAYESWQNEDGIFNGHRLRVEITLRQCPDCPAHNALFTSYVTVDADSVTLL